MLRVNVLAIVKNRGVIGELLVSESVACYLLTGTPDARVLNLIEVFLGLGGINSGIGGKALMVFVSVIETESVYGGSIRIQRNIAVSGHQARFAIASANGFGGRGFAVVVIPRVCTCSVSHSRREER